jgi:uncharacterized protein
MMETIMEKTEAMGMLCPHCRVDLVMTERQGVEIDYCPKCRGIWLDRGELDKIVERALGEAGASAPAVPALFMPRAAVAQGPWSSPGSREEASSDRARGYREDSDDHHRDRRHRRESFLERLFD